MFKNVLGAVAALSMAAMPAVASAQSNPAASLSVSKSVRSGTTTSGKSKLGAGGGGIFAILILAGVVAIGVVAATKDDKPSSR